MTKLTAIITVLFATGVSFGQHKNLNQLYAELGGNGLFLSLNYERQIIPKAHIYLNTGYGIYGIRNTYSTIPFGVKYLLKFKNKRNVMEFGLGATYTQADVKLYIIVDNRSGIRNNIQALNIVPSIFYRHISNNNFVFRAGLTPVFNQYEGIPFIGVSFGKLF